ncbi:MAG: putative glycerophosphodiester phosphodiesterase [Acidimicrobiaceae bacterium]|nr:putative glycerophosphodiester phosphodiesterase [Acidimicrobiaceae bacterium]
MSTIGSTNTELEVSTTLEPTHDGDHERMSHIVLEGFKPKVGKFVSAGNSVVEGMVNGTPVRALCGKEWTPGRDPKRYPLCPTCAEIAKARGWKLPAH